MLTRIFKSGNSLAVRIPKELAILSASQDVEIEKVGNTLVLRPVQQRQLAELSKVLAKFSPDFMAQGREQHSQQERQWQKDSAKTATITARAVKKSATKKLTTKATTKTRAAKSRTNKQR
jgi:antitoxin VapB